MSIHSVFVLVVILSTIIGSDGKLNPVKHVKPDTCPVPPKDLITPCVVKCSMDDDCPGNEKCCNYGCSIQCMEPVKKGKPGTCPVPPIGQFAPCVVKCSGDDVCPGTKKCCHYGCSIQCMEPVKKGLV